MFSGKSPRFWTPFNRPCDVEKRACWSVHWLPLKKKHRIRCTVSPQTLAGSFFFVYKIIVVVYSFLQTKPKKLLQIVKCNSDLWKIAWICQISVNITNKNSHRSEVTLWAARTIRWILTNSPRFSTFDSTGLFRHSKGTWSRSISLSCMHTEKSVHRWSPIVNKTPAN